MAVRTSSRSSYFRSPGARFMALAFVMAASAGLALAASPQQGPVFRAAVDLIAVDVQVVDRDGVPVDRIGPDAFSVSINGQERRVVSAEFVRQASAARVGLSGARYPRNMSADLDTPDDVSGGRMFILAIDNGSFEPGTIRPAMEAAQEFVNGLEASDRIGLYVYPTGPRIEPTTERAPIRAALGTVTGEKWSVHTRFNLQPSEIVDITAGLGMGLQTRQNTLGVDPSAPQGATITTASLPPDWDAVLRVVRRECPGQVDCPAQIINEVAAIAPHIENQVESSRPGRRARPEGRGPRERGSSRERSPRRPARRRRFLPRHGAGGRPRQCHGVHDSSGDARFVDHGQLAPADDGDEPRPAHARQLAR
jgi:hypothetical protein